MDQDWLRIAEFLQRTLTSFDEKRSVDCESLLKEIINVSFLESTLESIFPFFGFCSSAYWLMPPFPQNIRRRPAYYLSVANSIELTVHF